MENHTKTSWSSDNLSVFQILGKASTLLSFLSNLE